MNDTHRDGEVMGVTVENPLMQSSEQIEALTFTAMSNVDNYEDDFMFWSVEHDMLGFVPDAALRSTVESLDESASSTNVVEAGANFQQNPSTEKHRSDSGYSEPSS